MPQMLPLRDDEVVYIAIRNLSFMDAVTGEISPAAFFMRARDAEGDPPHGISSVVLDHCPTIEEIKNLTGLKSKVCGVDFLHAGHIRKIGLEVVRTSEAKALIVGMPYPAEDYPALEQRNILASKLAAISLRGIR